MARVGPKNPSAASTPVRAVPVNPMPVSHRNSRRVRPQEGEAKPAVPSEGEVMAEQAGGSGRDCDQAHSLVRRQIFEAGNAPSPATIGRSRKDRFHRRATRAGEGVEAGSTRQLFEAGEPGGLIGPGASWWQRPARAGTTTSRLETLSMPKLCHRPPGLASPSPVTRPLTTCLGHHGRRREGIVQGVRCGHSRRCDTPRLARPGWHVVRERGAWNVPFRGFPATPVAPAAGRRAPAGATSRAEPCFATARARDARPP